jgi:hypothetical protein
MMFQVITKIVNYELKPGQIYEGVWHVEGMSHEEIVLTALYILERDESISGGDLTFKRAFFRDEAEVIFSGVPQIICKCNVTPFVVQNLVKVGPVPNNTAF